MAQKSLCIVHNNAMELDKIHYSFNSLDGYNKPVNFIVSPRGDGKTTAFLVGKAWPAFVRDGQATIVQRRFINDITEKYIEGLAGIINKFTGAGLKLSYKITQLKKDGVIDVFAQSHGGKRIFTIVAMNTRLSNLKGLFQSDTRYWLCDEFICNPKMDERYIKGEAFKFREAFNTLARENFKMKAYFLGNPYSLYNPYFQDWGVNPAIVSRQRFTSGKKWIVEYHKLSDELRDYYLENNPMYDEESTYTLYALDGSAILDKNIRVMDRQPPSFVLHFVFAQNGTRYGIFKNMNILDDNLPTYWVGTIESLSRSRNVFVFDFDELEEGASIFSRFEREMLAGFASSMRRRDVGFETINCFYACQEVYTLL